MRVMKKISILLFIILFSLAGSGIAHAQTIDPCPANSIFSALCNIGIGNINKAVQSFITILLVAAVILSVIFLVYGGVKWILAGGDKQGIESARGMIVGAIVGLVIAFAAFFLFNLILYLFGVSGTGALTIPTLI